MFDYFVVWHGLTKALHFLKHFFVQFYEKFRCKKSILQSCNKMKFFHSCNDKIFLLFISFEKTSSFSTWSKTPILDVCNVKNFHVIVMWGKSQKRTWNFYRKWISHPLSMKSSRQSYHNRLKMCKILHKFDHINFFLQWTVATKFYDTN